MNFREILKIISTAARKKETVEIYYPKTENTPEGWRKVEPYSLTNDTEEDAEHLVYGKDRMSPGHIFNGYTVGSGDKHLDSFIIGKIKKAKFTYEKFKPKREIEF